MKSSPARGMKDILPKDAALREYVKSKILNQYKMFGFEYIETPCVENIALLSNGEGGENEKMIYKILKRGEKLRLDYSKLTESMLVDLGLRYDLTVPLVRFFANNKKNIAAPFKSVQIGPVWRAERPQKGRYRQFIQCDIDVIGDSSPLVEIELILATMAVLTSFKLKDLVLRINDRNILLGLVSYYGFHKDSAQDVLISLDKLDKIGVSGVFDELLNKGYENEKVKKLMMYISEVTDKETSSVEKLKQLLLLNIEESVVSYLITIIEATSPLLEKMNCKIVFDPTLVRGMSYYTGQIFEVGSSEFKGSIAGGGRYDNMVGKFLNETIPACGFSIGFERLITILEDKAEFQELFKEEKIALLYSPATDKLKDIIMIAMKYREQGKIVKMIQIKKNIGHQLKELINQGFDGYCLIDQDGDTNNLEVRML